MQDSLPNKKCCTCKRFKNCNEFYSDKSSRSGLSVRCASCQRNLSAEYYRANKRTQIEKSKARHFVNRNYLKKYGLTPVDYNQLLMKQGHCCKICGASQSTLSKQLAVDHCHVTGKVRGLLCSTCNTGLGQFKDSVDLLDKARNYLCNIIL